MLSDHKIACITMDIEADLGDPAGRVRLLEDMELQDRYVGIIQAYNVKVTGFLVTNLLPRYGPALRHFSARVPIEYGVHSHTHEIQHGTAEQEVEAAIKAFEGFWQQRPTGYRAPNGLIDQHGFQTLMDFGFEYDSSIHASMRFDRYGYSNLHLPNTPFRVVNGSRSIVEVPIASLRGLRLMCSLSFVKLLGMRTYKLLMPLFPLPAITIFNAHPYDFYAHLNAQHIPGWKKYAHLRNAHQAYALYEAMIALLQQQGYEFMFMSELYDLLSQHALAHVPLQKV